MRSLEGKGGAASLARLWGHEVWRTESRCLAAETEEVSSRQNPRQQPAPAPLGPAAPRNGAATETGETAPREHRCEKASSGVTVWESFFPSILNSGYSNPSVLFSSLSLYQRELLGGLTTSWGGRKRPYGLFFSSLRFRGSVCWETCVAEYTVSQCLKKGKLGLWLLYYCQVLQNIFSFKSAHKDIRLTCSIIQKFFYESCLILNIYFPVFVQTENTR